MDAKIFAGAVAATAVALAIGVAPSADATSNSQVVGIEESLVDPNGTEIAYTVTKILPSGDAVAYPLAGRLYEASVMARSLQGTTVPMVPFFSARAPGGANYPALVGVSGLSAAPLGEGATTDGKIYFDVVGDVPSSVVYEDGPGNRLTWTQPSAGSSMAGGSSGGGGGGESAGSGGSNGVLGSTGPNDVSPQTSGGEAGNTGEGGTEGGGGNLSSGGGSGAPNGDTGGNSGVGS